MGQRVFQAMSRNAHPYWVDCNLHPDIPNTKCSKDISFSYLALGQGTPKPNTNNDYCPYLPINSKYASFFNKDEEPIPYLSSKICMGLSYEASNKAYYPCPSFSCVLYGGEGPDMPGNSKEFQGKFMHNNSQYIVDKTIVGCNDQTDAQNQAPLCQSAQGGSICGPSLNTCQAKFEWGMIKSGSELAKSICKHATDLVNGDGSKNCLCWGNTFSVQDKDSKYSPTNRDCSCISSTSTGCGDPKCPTPNYCYLSDAPGWIKQHCNSD